MDVREGETVEFEREMGSGAASVPASDSSIIRMIRECDGDAFEARLLMNRDLTFRYAQAEFERKGLPLGPGEMRTLGILNPDGAFTNLGLRLSDQCPPTMRVAVFSDDSRSVFTERRECALSGPTLVPAMPSAVEIVSLGDCRWVSNTKTFPLGSPCRVTVRSPTCCSAWSLSRRTGPVLAGCGKAMRERGCLRK